MRIKQIPREDGKFGSKMNVSNGGPVGSTGFNIVKHVNLHVVQPVFLHAVSSIIIVVHMHT